MTRSARGRGKRERRAGSALVLTLWVITGLISVTLLFGHSMTLNYRGADYQYAAAQADQAVESGIRYAMYVLANQDEVGAPLDPLSYVYEEAELGEAFFWFIGRAIDGANTSRDPEFGLIDEASKLNLNTATVEMLQALPGMTPELAAAIVDWRDEDDEPSENGAESETYGMRTPGYASKNAPFHSVEELRYLEGAEIEILYGEDINMNGVLDPNENDGDETPPADNSDGFLDYGILEYVTVFTTEPAADEEEEDARGADGADGADEENLEGKINANTAPVAVLKTIPGIDEAAANTLVATRSTLGADALADISWVEEALEADSWSEAEEFLTVSSYQYTVDVAAVGRNGRGFRRARAVVDLSGDTPVVRYRRDMTRMGWALGETVREQIVERRRR